MRKVLLVLCLGLVASMAKAVEKVPQTAFYILYSQNESGGMQMRCTATAFKHENNKTYLITAAHCVVEGSPKPGEVQITRDPMFVSSDDINTKTFTKVSIEKVGKLMEGYDFAVLSTEDASLAKNGIVPLGDESKEETGVEVINVSAPRGIGRVLFRGNVSLMYVDRPIIDEDQHINWHGSMLVQLPAEGGSSGSAIISMDTGKIIGILVGTYSHLTIAVPISRAINTDQKFLLPLVPGVSHPDTLGPSGDKVQGPVKPSSFRLKKNSHYTLALSSVSSR